MNLEKAKPVNEEVAELKELIKELHGSVHQLQSEVQQLRHERPVVEVRKRCSIIANNRWTNWWYDFRWVSNYRYILVMKKGMQHYAAYLLYLTI